MKLSGRTITMTVLPLLLGAVACTGPVINTEEPEEVDSCEWLIPIGIELVNDYVYTLPEIDVGATGGDPSLLPPEIAELNARGADLDARAVELGCDSGTLNREIADATAGIESDDPIVEVFLESVRGGVVAPVLPVHGEWEFQSATVPSGELEPVTDHQITLIIDDTSASGYAGCNGYFYPVDLADGSWVWAEGTATITELSCIDEDGNERTQVMEIEAAFIEALARVGTYELTEGAVLVLSGDTVELRFLRSAGD